MMSVKYPVSDAQAPRQSGLRKPRPLRSVSVQEYAPENQGRSDDVRNMENYQAIGNTMTSAIPVDLRVTTSKCDSKISNSKNSAHSTFQRQLSAPSGSSSGSSPPGDNHQNRSRGSGAVISPVKADGPPVYKRKNANADQVDYNSNSIVGIEEHSSAETGGSGRGRYHRGKRTQASRLVSDHKDAGSKFSIQGLPDNNSVIVTTLLTAKGEELALTGRNMPTVLLASRILLNELSAKIVKMETYSDDTGDDEDDGDECGENTSVKSTDEKHSIPAPCLESEPPRPVNPDTTLVLAEKQKPTNRQYSKQELLQLSTSRFSRQPPAKWNVLSVTHSDCCLPASKVCQYFDPAKFHFHDGALVSSDSRHHQRDRDDQDRHKV